MEESIQRQRGHRRLSLSHCSEAVRLDVARYQLYRDEKDQLRDAWLRILNGANKTFRAPAETVFVHGNGSTGKSAFVLSLQRPVEISSGVFLSGTHSNKGSNQPYAVITDMIVELCEEVIAEMGLDEFHAYLEQILGEDLSTVARFVPKLAEILRLTAELRVVTAARAPRPLLSGHNKIERTSSATSLTGGKSDHAQSLNPTARAVQSLVYHVRKLLRALANRSNPILFLVEDLHLADPPSLNLFLSLVNDSDIKNVLFVGTYTDGEIDRDSRFSNVSAVLSSRNKMTDLHLKEMTIHEVNQLVAATTQMPAIKTFALGCVVHQRTGGNFYLVTQFLELLQELHLLLYSFKTNVWEWDLPRIESETDVSDNVANIVVSRIHHLPESAQTVLKISACLGSQFELALVALIISSENNYANSPSVTQTSRIFDEIIEIPTEFDTTAIEENFEYLFQTGLVENGSMGLSKFSHEKVQQASYALIAPGPERDHLHLRIGRLLYELHEDPAFNKEWMFFSAIDQFNKVSSCIKHLDDILELIRLNIVAAELAMSKSAFLIAATYLAAGVELLEKSNCDHWDSHYELCIDIYSAAAEMEQCVGNTDKCLVLINEVFENGMQLEDKLRAYYVKIQVFGSQGSLEEAVRTGFSVLKELGVHIPKKPRSWNVVGETIRTKKMLKGRSNESLVSGARLEDPIGLMKLEMLHLVSMYCYVWQGSDFLPIIFLRSIQYSLLHGISEYTPYAFANFAVLLVNSGEVDEGYRFAQLALQMLDSISGQSKAEVLFVIHSYLYHWKHPLRRSLDPLMKSYSIAMDTGSVEVALSSADAYAMVYTCAGLPLNHVASDLRRFKKQTVDYNLDTVQAVMAPGLQYVLNLLGENDDPLELTGEAMIQSSLLTSAEESGNRVAAKAVYRYRLLLATLFGETKAALDIIGDIPTDEINCHFGYAREAFACALTYLEVARTAKKRHYLRRAQTYIKLLHKWTKAGNVNCHDMLLLLQAEIMALQKREKPKDIREAYDLAISTSSRCGYIHNAALANEKAAAYFRSTQDSFWAEHYMEKAHDLYMQWNAWGKVKQLEIENPNLRDLRNEGDDGGSARSGSLQGRTRFKRQIHSKHEKINYHNKSGSEHNSGRRRTLVLQSELRSDHLKRRPSDRSLSHRSSEHSPLSARGREISPMRSSRHRQGEISPLGSSRHRRTGTSPLGSSRHRRAGVSPRRSSAPMDLSPGRPRSRARDYSPRRSSTPTRKSDHDVKRSESVMANKAIRKLSRHTFRPRSESIDVDSLSSVGSMTDAVLSMNEDSIDVSFH